MTTVKYSKDIILMLQETHGGFTTFLINYNNKFYTVVVYIMYDPPTEDVKHKKPYVDLATLPFDINGNMSRKEMKKFLENLVCEHEQSRKDDAKGKPPKFLKFRHDMIKINIFNREVGLPTSVVSDRESHTVTVTSLSFQGNVYTHYHLKVDGVEHDQVVKYVFTADNRNIPRGEEFVVVDNTLEHRVKTDGIITYTTTTNLPNVLLMIIEENIRKRAHVEPCSAPFSNENELMELARTCLGNKHHAVDQHILALLEQRYTGILLQRQCETYVTRSFENEKNYRCHLGDLDKLSLESYNLGLETYSLREENEKFECELADKIDELEEEKQKNDELRQNISELNTKIDGIRGMLLGAQ